MGLRDVPRAGGSPSVELCDKCLWEHAEGSWGRGRMRPQTPQGTHLMGIKINNGSSGDALHSLKQKLPRGKGRHEDPDGPEDAAPQGLVVGKGSRQEAIHACRLSGHQVKISYAQESCAAPEKHLHGQGRLPGRGGLCCALKDQNSEGKWHSRAGPQRQPRNTGRTCGD